jgi:protein-S-isoprenylcysteine O-methyltransferase Ste14
MNSKLLIIITFSYLYVFFEIFMSVKLNQKKNIIKSGDKGSLWLLYIFITIGYMLSFSIGATKTGRMYPWNTFFIIGILLILFGLTIRITSIVTLKQYFTYNVTQIKDHVLIDEGLYKFIRHPGYLGQIIIFSGIAISLSNWLSVLCMLLSVIPVYIYRIHIEERFLLMQMGGKYIDYQKRTKRLIPKIY